jgi:hypothetical protein
MKVFVCLLALMVATPLFAQQEGQEKQEPQESMPYTKIRLRDLAFSVGLGLEANGYPRGVKTNDNALKGIGAGGLVSMDLQWSPAFAAGLKGSYNINFDDYTAWDLQALFRWYFVQSFAPYPRRNNFFIQGEGGIVFQREPIATTTHAADEVVQGWGGGALIGTRFSLKPNLYIEPYVRAGYPWLWGAGVVIGYTFHYLYSTKNGSAAPGTMRDAWIIVVNHSATPNGSLIR